MKITSPAFENNQTIPIKYTCHGEKINPPLKFWDIPNNTKSLTLIVDDPDAPNGNFVHWIVFNISPSITEIKENSVPLNSMQGITSINKSGYVSPCPPSSTHRYIFKLYALDEDLNLPANSDKQTVENAMQGHILTQADLIGLYSSK